MDFPTAEQMTAVGAAMAKHGITPDEAVELYVTAAGGQHRPLTAAEAAELVDRLDAMPRLIVTLRGVPCDAWPFSSWPARSTRRRTHGTQ